MTREREAGLSEARFRALAEAYGGDMARWPRETQAAARAMAAQAGAHATMADARALDAALDRFTLAPPSPALAARILQETGRGRSLRLAVKRALIGAGLLGVGLAGGLTGVAAVMIAAPPPTLTSEDNATAFGVLTPDLVAVDIDPAGTSANGAALPAMEAKP